MSNPDGVLDAIDSTLRDYSISSDAMRWAPDVPAPTVSFRVAADITRFMAGMADTARALTEGSKPIAQAVRTTQAAFHKLTHQRDRKHRARCAVCNPAGNPKSMPINRAEYRRRRR